MIQYRVFHSCRPLLTPAEDSVDKTYSEAVQHDYKMSPGSGPILSPLSEEAIHQLLSERVRCMTERDSEGLRRVQERLAVANVFLDDIAKEWRADGTYRRDFSTRSQHEFYRLRPTAEGARQSRPLDNGDENESNQTSGAKVIFERDDGAFDHKHDYRLAADAGPNASTLTEEEIHNLLAERYFCRRRRSYERSDAIRRELETHGIYVDDKNKKWRADGFKFPNQCHNYKLRKGSGPITATISDDEIHKLLAKRQYYKCNQDFDRADQILRQLDQCGVSVDDMKREWRADGVRFAQFRHPYKKSPEAGPSRTTMSEGEIHMHLAKHWHYKSVGGFSNTVSWIADVLATAGIFLDEETNEWRADGVRHNYRLSSDAGPNISNLSDDEINTLLEKRMRCRWKQHFRTADEIRDQLENAGVFVDDKKKQWRADNISYYEYRHKYKLCADAGPNTSSMSLNKIHKLLDERWQFKLARDFSEADRLSYELFNSGVYVNDRTEEWRADGKACNFTLVPGAGPIKAGLPEEKIHLLLETSIHYKMKNDFISANSLHTQLLGAGVYIDQENNQWRGDGIFHHYSLCPLAGRIRSHLFVSRIHELLGERWKYKISQDFASADRVYDELLLANVYVDDEFLEWRADGIFHVYRQSPDSEPFIATLKEDEIHHLLGKRLRYKKRRDFKGADHIHDILQKNHVYVDDRIKEWRGDGIKYPFLLHRYRLSPDSGPIKSSLPVSKIHELLRERRVAKAERDFDKADRALLQLYRAGVYVNETRKEWRADGVDFPDERYVRRRRKEIKKDKGGVIEDSEEKKDDRTLFFDKIRGEAPGTTIS